VRSVDLLGDGEAEVGSDHDPSILSWATWERVPAR